MGVFSYAAAQGYIRARLSRFIDRATWDRLLDAASPEELGQFLRRTRAAPAVTPSGVVHLGILRGEVASSERTVARFLPRSTRELVAWYNKRFEIENLKAVLRAVHYQLDQPRALSSLIPLPFTRWNWESLLEWTSVTALIDQVRDSPYARPLENSMERYQQEHRLFYLEVAIDLFYFQKLVRLIESQTGRDGDDARQFLGRWIAVQNLLWAYRYRVHGQMTPEEIINYTLHRAFAAGLDTIRRIALGSTLTLEAERLGFHLPAGLPEVDALTELELQAERERFQRARAVTGRALFGLGGVLGYLWLVEGQVQDLIVLVEGKSTGLSAPEIARRLTQLV